MKRKLPKWHPSCSPILHPNPLQIANPLATIDLRRLMTLGTPLAFEGWAQDGLAAKFGGMGGVH